MPGSCFSTQEVQADHQAEATGQAAQAHEQEKVVENLAAKEDTQACQDLQNDIKADHPPMQTLDKVQKGTSSAPKYPKESTLESDHDNERHIAEVVKSEGSRGDSYKQPDHKNNLEADKDWDMVMDNENDLEVIQPAKKRAGKVKKSCKDVEALRKEGDQASSPALGTQRMMTSNVDTGRTVKKIKKATIGGLTSEWLETHTMLKTNFKAKPRSAPNGPSNAASISELHNDDANISINENGGIDDDQSKERERSTLEKMSSRATADLSTARYDERASADAAKVCPSLLVVHPIRLVNSKQTALLVKINMLSAEHAAKKGHKNWAKVSALAPQISGLFGEMLRPLIKELADTNGAWMAFSVTEGKGLLECVMGDKAKEYTIVENDMFM
ncbi:uncharacterized protein PHACADRAFT_26110 [Phanerochaete carnosa HHB-10118-sp]|uniref:Uncharacterized protein n=1 Tax=Phanerochaete carnosa (strain HHB-10118-sp) TaxID=650164 RepID=K5W863_PHACS|nr:uncharacterized protein PHACADRAFT_26110 [Phanerochaete carnosa HHB-10118-sp]EKM60143.1 hypothetical protein PHACADRAFT_26110 [Phanerochaete carnosa HHB-10118-sp]